MDMTAEAIVKVQEIAAPITFPIKDVHDVETIYSSKQLHQIKAAPPEHPDDVNVCTLAGFADLVRAGLEEKDFPSCYVIHVVDEKTVVLKSKLSDKYGRRLVLIVAQPVPFNQFRFQNWMSQEEFAIAVASLFSDESPDKQYILDLASTLTNEATVTSEDNGFTQKGTVKQGMRTLKPVTIKPRVSMAPYRTFPEIPQPISQFVLRAKAEGGDSKPTLMLVEADGGRWKIDAIAEIKRAMEAFGLNIPIIA
jgi:hypothetical protein